MIRVLFVCMGNICRSPTAQGVFESLLAEAGLAHAIEADSAGTHGYHVGKPPDARATEAAAQRGIDLSGLRARRVVAADFHAFDLVLAMDRDNFRDLARIAPEGRADRLRLFLDYAPETGALEVPDPYYGGADGFERVLDLIEAASRGLLAELRAAVGGPPAPPGPQS
ncbi:MAG TPA: low molecular weight protein-tyrosine-phosphatase [Alphaproteobacteria bacterium]|nr:low molecular weight protein-tyrosine-phosphatase [Alphaproteobacteria bacterium]